MPPTLGWGLGGHGSHPKEFLGAVELQKLPGCHDSAEEVRVWMLSVSRSPRPPEAPRKVCVYRPSSKKGLSEGSHQHPLSWLHPSKPSLAQRSLQNPHGNRGLRQKAVQSWALKSTFSRALGPSLQLCSLGPCRAMSWVRMSWGRKKGSRMSGLGVPGPSLAHIGSSA